MVKHKLVSDLSDVEKFDILEKGLPITSSYNEFSVDEIDGMKKLPQGDYLRCLLDDSASISSSDLNLYLGVRNEFEKRDPIEKLSFIAKSTGLYNPKKISFDSVDSVALNILSLYLKLEYPAEKRLTNTLYWDAKVASPDKIIEDLKLSQNFDLIPPLLKGNLTPRAVVGHAQKGHCSFIESGAKINTTLDSVITDKIMSSFLNKKGLPFYDCAKDFLHETQRYIDNLGSVVDIALNPTDLSLRNSSLNLPNLLFNFRFLKNIPIDYHAFLKGLHFGGSFDNYSQVRRLAFEHYGVNMGGGRTWLINKKLVKGLGINMTDLTQVRYKDPVLKELSSARRMDLFHYVGLLKKDFVIDYKNARSWQDILDQSEPIPDGYFQEYVRDFLGPGGSDDLLCMSAAWLDFQPKNLRRDPLWYFWLQMGARLNDFVDTLTKASSRYLPGGQDEVIAKYANARFLDKLRNTPYYASSIGIDMRKLEKSLQRQGTQDFVLNVLDDVVDFTAIGINPSHNKFPVKGKSSEVHSSARYFAKVQSTSFDYTNFNTSPSKGVTTAMDQQMYVTHKYLDKSKAQGTTDGQFLYPVDKDVEVGFQKHPLNSVIGYFNKQIFPVISSAPKKRKELIQHFYDTYRNFDDKSRKK
ncbi:MAG: hypothetical protein ACLFNM_03725 [Candidatus Woesearchaeota archaeon]